MKTKKNKISHDVWLAVQISQQQNDELEEICAERNILKTHFVRLWLDNLKVFSTWQEAQLLKQAQLEKTQSNPRFGKKRGKYKKGDQPALEDQLDETLETSEQPEENQNELTEQPADTTDGSLEVDVLGHIERPALSLDSGEWAENTLHTSPPEST